MNPDFFASLAQPGVQGMRTYNLGHDLVALRRELGDAMVIELGSNENSYGPSSAARTALLAATAAIHRYPDPQGAQLKRALGIHHGLEPAQVILGNGSHELLMQIAQVFAGPGLEVIASQYGFAVYMLAAQAAGARLRSVDAHPRAHPMPLGHDLDAIAGAISPATRLIYLANPNNPTGTWFSTTALRTFLAVVPADVLVVVDEAYAEYVDVPDCGSAIALLQEHPNLIVTRTFSKAYALAGLRIGYAAAHPDLIAVLERLRESFNVNVLALATAEAALADRAHLAQTRARNVRERAILAEALLARGHRVYPSQTNFLLVEFASDVARLEAALVARGIVVRPVGAYGLPQCLRITVGSGEENRRLLSALAQIGAGVEARAQRQASDRAAGLGRQCVASDSR